MRPWSSAAPMAGTCEQPTPATTLATALLRQAAVALNRAAATDHHLEVFLLGHARHRSRDILKGEPVGGGDLRSEVDVAAQVDHLVPIPLQDRLLLLLRHREPIHVSALVRL